MYQIYLCFYIILSCTISSNQLLFSPTFTLYYINFTLYCFVPRALYLYAFHCFRFVSPRGEAYFCISLRYSQIPNGNRVSFQSRNRALTISPLIATITGIRRRYYRRDLIECIKFVSPRRQNNTTAATTRAPARRKLHRARWTLLPRHREMSSRL